MHWTAEIMTDPARDHQLHVELQEDGRYRGRLYMDEQGSLQLHIYAGSESKIPVDWLLGIVDRFSEDMRVADASRQKETRTEKAIA